MLTEFTLQAEHEYRRQRFLQEAEAHRLAKLAQAGNAANGRKTGLVALFGRVAPRHGRSSRSRSDAAADLAAPSGCAA